MITKLLRLIAALLTLAGVGFAVTMHPPAAHTTQLRTPVKLPLSQAAMFYNGPQVVQAELHLIRPRPRPTPVHRTQPTPTPTPSPSSTYVPPPATTAPPASVSSVQLIAYDLLPSYGFDQGASFTCLVQLWNRESGWRYDAEEPTSGAYGIPQSLPASKMAMFGSDYLTDPRTQIRWGLWYIQTTYGTPCNAWVHDYSQGWY